MHYDPVYARALGFRGTIAHGTLLLAPLVDLALHRYGQAFLVRGRLVVKWTAPVCAGEVQLASIDESGRIEAANTTALGSPVTIRGQASLIGVCR